MQDIPRFIRESWQRLHQWPMGKQLFTKSLGLYVPYTGTLPAVFEEITPEGTLAYLYDRRKIRNHLKSIHAIALANFAEMVSGVGLMSILPGGGRGILKSFQIDYLKKARGRITGRCALPRLAFNQKDQILKLTIELFDQSGSKVCCAVAEWKISISPERTPP